MRKILEMKKVTFIPHKWVLAEMYETAGPSGKEITLQFYGSFSFFL